ncbi:MAG: hypothetical protein ABR936_11865 [Bacteroidota bacterium]|jgi:hypothetical protein
MPKQPSVITIAKSGNNYRVDARGALGGGYTQSVPKEEIKSALAIAWMQYGRNPLGCDVVGTVDGLEDYIATLKGDKKSTAILVKVSETEKLAIEVAAKASGAESVTDYLLTLHRAKTK